MCSPRFVELYQAAGLGYLTPVKAIRAGYG